jgi:MurNAc alpha-1-phosphate uridylyltransferase
MLKPTRLENLLNMPVKPAKAMVLAAGLGVRMRPLTDRMPKPLVPVAGRPLLDHVLDKLAEAGVREAVVNVHYLPDQIIDHVASRAQPHVTISDERNIVLGTGGGVVKALPLLGNAPFFHVNADTMWIDGVRSNLARLAEAFDPARMDILLHRLSRPRRLCDGGRRHLAQAQGTSGGAVRLCRRGDHVAGDFRRRANRRIFADQNVRSRQ